MNRVCVICEGQTEEIFIRDVVAPRFYGRLNLIPEMVESSQGHRGGALSYERVKHHLCNRLRQQSLPFVTTFFDLYRLDSRFPGQADAGRHEDHATKITVLNQSFHRDVVAAAGCAPDRFIPHIQPHEFEALLFSNIHTLVAMEAAWNTVEKTLQAVRDAVPTPEHINNRPDTKPAAHLEQWLKSPKYKKSIHGPQAAAHIGLDRIMAECPCFANWIQRMESLT